MTAPGSLPPVICENAAVTLPLNEDFIILFYLVFSRKAEVSIQVPASLYGFMRMEMMRIVRNGLR